MITNISIVTLWVKDVDETAAFYTEKFGFTVDTDITLGDGYRWCTLNSPSQPELQVHLSVPGPPLSPELAAAITRAQDEGGMAGFGLAVDDCRATFAELSANGVVFLQEPEDRPYGVEALCRDNNGNWLVLVEQREFDGSDFAHG
jgi:catechol 2,3-dioxygenase-like lactoylglutathione lyase family enzyme